MPKTVSLRDGIGFWSELFLDHNGSWAAYWLFIVPVVTGWWMVHAGSTKRYEMQGLGESFGAGRFI